MKTLRSKILTGFGIVVILAGILGVNSVIGIKDLLDNSQKVTEEQLPKMIIDTKLTFNIAERVAMARGYILYEREYYVEEFNRLTEESGQLQQELEVHTDSEEVKDLLAKSEEWSNLMRGNAAELANLAESLATSVNRFTIK